ncbi:MAG: NAD(P)/FAD-dependent oxidoreductase [Candidatus Nanohalobium sp.]
MRDLIVIGGASAAQSAAIYAVRAGVEVTVVADEYGGQINNTDKVENYLGIKSIGGPELGEKFVEHMRDYDIEEKKGLRATEVRKKEDGNFEVELEDGEVLESRAVIIATGGHRRKLDVEGEQEFTGKGVSYCAVCDGPLYQGEEVAVVGAGYAGTEAAAYLTDVVEKVHIINRSEGFSGEEITIKQVREAENVDHHENAQIQEIYGENLVEGLKYERDGEVTDLEVAGVFIEIGTVPNSGISDLVETTESGYIEVNPEMETGTEGLYAAGDVADIGAQQLVVSAGQGCQAGLNAAEYIKEKKSEA